MKYKNKLKNLEARQRQWDSFSKDVQAGTTRPGSKNK